MKRDYRIGAWTFEPGRAGVCRIEVKSWSRVGVNGIAALATNEADEYETIPNVSGQRQTKCHDFPDIEPDDPEPTIMDDVETLDNDSPLDTVDTDNRRRYKARPWTTSDRGTQLERKTTMIGAAVITLGDVTLLREYDNVKLLGTSTGNRMLAGQLNSYETLTRWSNRQTTLGPRPNVTGQRQTKCHDFPDIEPDDPETPVLDDVEPVSGDSPVGTVDCADSPRQETVPYLVWGAMKENTVISDMVRELQPHDRDDLRQDMALKYWRKAVRQELRGDRTRGLICWLTADVRQWIGERTDIAVGEPLTKQQIDDAKGDTLLLQRSASEESRLEKLEHELRIVQSQFAAEIEAKRRQSKPRAILALKW